jgi:hypothetical protein
MRRLRKTAPIALASVAAGLLVGPAHGFAGMRTTPALDLLPPVAVPDRFTLVHDRPLTVDPPGVLANDLDLDGRSRALLDKPPEHGALELERDGGFAYTPESGFVGVDGFSYRATGGLLGSATAAVTLKVVNNPPIAVVDAYEAVAGRRLVVAAPGVLANDLDAEDDPMSVELVRSPQLGSLKLAADGGFDYLAPSGVAGVDTFVYRAWDGAAWSADAVVSIAVRVPAQSITPPPTPATPRPTATLRPPATPRPAPTPRVTASPDPPAGPTPTPAPTPAATVAERPRPTSSPSPRAEGAATAPASPSSSPSTGGGGHGGDGRRFDFAPVRFEPADALFGSEFGVLADVEWAVPTLLLSVPGLLIVLAVVAQAAVAALSLPLIRRWLGGFGLRRRRPSSEGEQS